MQLLTILPHYNAMTVQLSVTGITTLKLSKFKTRHNTPKELCQTPREGLILTKDDPTLTKSKPKKKRKVSTSTIPEITTVKKVPKPRSYSVNKKEVTHRIRNYINAMQGEKKLYFWTITFPAGTSDDTCFILFNKWLTRVRKELNLKSYLWVSERQEGKRLQDHSQQSTGTLHFHIAIHQRMCVQKANRYMRACIFTSIDNNELSYSRISAKNYNGVDIAKNRKTRRVINFAKGKNEKTLTNYLVKYMSKNHEAFTHLAWHCSRDYSNLITAIRITDDEYNSSDYQALLKTDKPFENDFIIFFPWAKGPPPRLLSYLAFANQTAQSILN